MIYFFPDYQETENSMKNTKKRGYSQVKTEVIAESTGDGKNLQDNSDNDMTDGSWNLDKTEEKKKKRYKKGYGQILKFTPLHLCLNQLFL